MSIPALAALPATRHSRELDSDSLSGSLSDSDFVSPSSTPLTVDTAATSDDDEQQQHVSREPTRMSNEQARPPSCPKQPLPSKPRRASSTTSPYLSCSSSLLRTTLFSFARFGLGSGSTGSPTSASSSSRRSSISSPSSTGSPIEFPSLHAKSTTEICTNSNPSLAQFSPTPPASSSLAIYAPLTPSYSSTSRRHALRSRSASSDRHQHTHSAHTAHSGSRARTHSLAFRAGADDGPTSSLQHSATSPRRFSGFWRKQKTPLSDPNSPPSTLVLPSLARAHVPDLVLPINVDGSSDLPPASTAASDGFLRIDGSRDGLTFRTAENGSGAKFFLGTPRPSYPITLGAEHNDLTVLVDSPVADDYDGLPNFEWKGKGKERATIPDEFHTGAAATAAPPLPAPSASIPIPIPPSPTQTHQTHERRIKIVLPPPPVRASTTPLLKPRPIATAASPPTLATIEQSSRLMRDRALCTACAAVGVDFPRCPRCPEAWCSRACRVAAMDELADGRRKHVCKT